MHMWHACHGLSMLLHLPLLLLIHSLNHPPETPPGPNPSLRCPTSPPVILNGQWNCTNTTIGATCTAQCAAGYDNGTPPSAICVAAPTAAAPNTTVWSVTGSCQQSPVTPGTTGPTVVYQTASLALGLQVSGGCSQQAADALGNGVVSDLEQLLLASSVGTATAVVKKGACSSSSSSSSASNRVGHGSQAFQPAQSC
jgi:hypothetical protein